MNQPAEHSAHDGYTAKMVTDRCHESSLKVSRQDGHEFALEPLCAVPSQTLIMSMQVLAKEIPSSQYKES